MSLILAMILFSLSMSVTPGPVNIITLSSGVNFGFRKTMPFVSGATLGFVLLLLAIGAGLSSVANQFPSFLIGLKYLGSGYVAYMGVGMIKSRHQLTSEKGTQPSFLQGALLQWLNPKAWIACIAGVSAFNLGHSFEELSMFASIYLVVCYFSISLWALSGQKIQRIVETPTINNLFNRLMGGFLIGIAGWLVLFQ